MGERRKGPWLRARDNHYYTTIGRRRVKLGPASASWADIERAYHAAHLSGGEDSITFGQLVAGLREYNAAHREPGTADWYGNYLPSLEQTIGPDTPALSVMPGVIQEWISGFGTGEQYNAARVACRVFNHAVKQRVISASPIRGIEKPAATTREFTLTQAQYAACIKHATPQLADVLRFMWRTGCRPQEMRAVQAAWLDGDKLVFPVKSSKGRKKRRVIYLTDIPLKIVGRLARDYPAGPIFRNRFGEPYTKNCLVTAFRRLRERAGIPELVPYTLRHTWITNRLKAGVDVATVAALSGNTVRTILQCYEHVARDDAHLRAALVK